MDIISDRIISTLTVRLKDTENGKYIGTGVLYYDDILKDKLYVITASHCLFVDGDNFQNQRADIFIDILTEDHLSYSSIKVTVNPDLLSREKEKDIAILILNKADVISISGEIPKIRVIKEKSTYNNFIAKGFPNATFGEEIAVLYPSWLQAIDRRFQLQLEEDYAAYNTQGFSGSGIFLLTENEFFLYGVFTRFRGEDKGKVIYCQFIENANELLIRNYLPLIGFEYFGKYGLTNEFFKKHIANSVKGLGPRFNEELNFQLPIAKIFNDLAKDTLFRKRLYKLFDNWILERGYGSLFENPHIDELENEFREIKSKTKEWIQNLDLSIDNPIEIEWLLDRLEALDEKASKKTDELYELRRKEEKKNPPTQKRYREQYPYEPEIRRLTEIRNINQDFVFDINRKLNINLINSPYLIIKGDAGNGKSHLLGDIAKKRILNNLPTLLLLGQNFSGHQNIWENLKSELSLQCSKAELLSELNYIGQQIGSRVLILIDAINEGGGANLWRTRIASFLNEFKDYPPYIGVVLTIRTTYLDHVIPLDVQKDPQVSILEHEGFKGNEYAALKLFCEFHDLKQPHFPILAPEFSNPLFLKIICEAIKDTPQKTFPQGFQGISGIFQLYIQSLNLRFEHKREEYKNRKIVERAIHLLAHESFNKEGRVLLLDEAFDLFDQRFSQFKNLITDLIEENVFIRRMSHNFETQKDEEVIYFAYERFGDFFIADDILSKFQTQADVLSAFEKNRELGKLIEEDFSRYDGVLEAFSVLLPERFALEFFEVFDWIYTDVEIKEYQREDKESKISRLFLDSLNWRKIESIDDDKIIEWFKSEKCWTGDDEYFLKLYELAPIKDHPFNSDRLFRILDRISMPKRDSFWQQHIRWYSGFDDYNNAFPIRRLIDWAWTPEISKKIDHETALLTSQALIWLLVSTHRKLRDETTKALVNILEQQVDALLVILEKCKKVNDPYLLERLYAIVYGCALRTEDNASVVKIARAVYKNVFRKGNPPNHVLLRDYARNTIEYAIHKNPRMKVDLDLIRPPYNSKLPEYFPSDEEIKKFDLDTDSMEFKQNNGRMNNKILYSVLDWDFGIYTIDSRLHDFHPARFTSEPEYKEFFHTLTSTQKKIMKIFDKLAKSRSILVNNKHIYFYSLGKEEYEKRLKSIKDLEDDMLRDAEELFSQDQALFINNKAIIHLEAKHAGNNQLENRFDTGPYKNWIINRVFELGYDYKIHGDYDTISESHNDRSENRIERIGKKYQWIAYHEVFAMISDNHKIFANWSDRSTYYQGPWQAYLRDIDPVFTKRVTENTDEDDFQFFDESKSWFSDPEYNNWRQLDSDWVINLADLPSVADLLQKKDENSNDWLSLKKIIRWKEPKTVGQDEYQRRRKEVRYEIDGFIIQKKDKTRILKWLNEQNFWDNRMPGNSPQLQLMNREKFWSPAYEDMMPDKKEWETIQNTRYKVIVATDEAVGEMSEDKSGARFYYEMPCKTLLEGMKLNYSSRDGDFINPAGDLVVQNINYKTFFKKTDLLSFLESNDLELVWTLFGEKMSYDSRDRANNFYKKFNGVFYLEKDKIEGSLRLFDGE